jgi:hypothetical protein
LGTGEDPLLYWGWEDEENPENTDACRFSEYVYRYIQGGRDRTEISGSERENGTRRELGKSE